MKIGFMAFFFDLDNTLIDSTGKLFPDVISILQVCQRKNLLVAIVSHNSAAAAICQYHGLDSYIHLVIAWHPNERLPISKQQHLSTALHVTKYKPEDCFFFDDVDLFVQEARRMGMGAETVPKGIGLTMQQFCVVCSRRGITLGREE